MAWYNAAWLYRVRLTVDHTKVSGTPTNHPVYVDLANLPAAFWSHVLNGGADIRVTTSDGTTEVAREVVRCDTSASAGEVHFKAPSLSSASDTMFYLYYGNAGASEPGVSATYGRNAVWANGFNQVFHLNEASGNTATDSTGNTNGDYSPGMPSRVSSIVGYGQDFSMAYVKTNRYEGATWTWETWANPDQTTSKFCSVIACALNYMLFDFKDSNLSVWSHDGLGNNNFGQSGVITNGTWHYVALSRSGNSTTNGYQAWRNGVNTGSANTGTWTSNSSSGDLYNGVMIATRYSQPGQEYDGKQAEARFSSVVRDQSYFLTTYNNQHNPATFYAVGAEETNAGRLLQLRKALAV